MAVNCCVAPAAREAEAGETAMEERVGAAGVTVSVAVPLTPLMVALRVVMPAAAPVARPALTVATLVEELVQLAVAVTSPVDPSDQVPVAVNCWVAPGAMVAMEGETAMLARAGGGVGPLPEPGPLEPARLLDPHPVTARAIRAAGRARSASRARGDK